MRNHEIENWALGIIDRVLRKEAIEDDRVELKAEWPQAHKAARRIAGHANAARGEPILWIIGVDEESGTVPGISFSDFEAWYRSVKSGFDELAPEPVTLNMSSQGVTVAALYFETDRAPFVVKNAEGGTIQREVPWREATGVRSATRSQLLRLLSPLQKLPHLEVVGALAYAEPWQSQDGRSFMNWEALVAIFLTQPSSQQTVFSSHQCQVKFNLPNGIIAGPYSGSVFRSEKGSTVKATRNAVVIDGPGMFEARTTHSVEWDKEKDQIDGETIQVDMKLHPAGNEKSVVVAIQAFRRIITDSKKSHWAFGRYSFSA